MGIGETGAEGTQGEDGEHQDPTPSGSRNDSAIPEVALYREGSQVSYSVTDTAELLYLPRPGTDSGFDRSRYLQLRPDGLPVEGYDRSGLDSLCILTQLPSYRDIERTSPESISAAAAECYQRFGVLEGSMSLCSHITDAGTVLGPRLWSDAALAAPAEIRRHFAEADGLHALHEEFLQVNGLTEHDVHLFGPFNPFVSCHGYTFSWDGRIGTIRPDLVDQVLDEQGFAPVWDCTLPNGPAAVRPGDVVIYRNDEGNVTHSGVVFGAGRDRITMASKLGMLTRCLHEPAQFSPYYGEYFEVHHTDRPGGRYLNPIPVAGYYATYDMHTRALLMQRADPTG